MWMQIHYPHDPPPTKQRYSDILRFIEFGKVRDAKKKNDRINLAEQIQST